MSSSSYNSALKDLQQHISNELGLPVKTILEMPLCELERRRAIKSREPMAVRHDGGCTLTTEQIEEMLDESLGYQPALIKVRAQARKQEWLKAINMPCH